MKESKFILLCALMSAVPAWADGQSGSNVNGGVNAACLIEPADSAAALALGCPSREGTDDGYPAAGIVGDGLRPPLTIDVVARDGATLNAGISDGKPPPEVTVTRPDGSVMTPGPR